MKRIIILLALTVLSTSPALASGNAAQGKALHEQKCTACHAAKFNGNGGQMYTRANRKVKSLNHLGQQVAACNAMLALDLFPEDEADLTAHLNAQFYKFK
ncbi:MAG: hypothetical protein D4R70_03675 [Betaproteobacteria bacterium]|nr:MAG: hypothetical protein D4R70_03675 [Betaproteobacteria bacterium]